MYGQVCSPVCECIEIRGQCQVTSIAPHRASYSLKLGGQQEPGMLLSPSPRAGVTEGQPGLCVRWTLDSFPCDYAVAVILPLSHLSHPDPKVLKGEKGFTGSPGLRHRRGDRQDLWWRWHWYCPRTNWPKDQSRELSIFRIYTENGLMTKAVLQSRRKQRSNNRMGLRVEGKTGIAHKMKQTAAHKGERPHQHSPINKNEYRLNWQC